MNIRSLLAVVAVSFAVLACDKADLPDDIVNNDGPGTVNPANVVAAKSEYRKMLNLSDGDVTLNSKGLPVKILGCDIEYLPATRAEGLLLSGGVQIRYLRFHHRRKRFRQPVQGDPGERRTILLEVRIQFRCPSRAHQL